MLNYLIAEQTIDATLLSTRQINTAYEALSRQIVSLIPPDPLG